MKKLAIIITHPIQYFAPLFQLLSKKTLIKVFYTWEQGQEEIYDDGFRKIIKWDIPLLEGYDYKFVKNSSKHPSITKFFGINNPTLIEEIEKWDANAILIFGWNFYSHLKVMSNFKGKIPVYFRGDSTLLDEKKGLKKILRRILLTWIYRNIDFALYVGKNNRAYFLKHGLKDKQLLFAPHAIDNDRFQKNNEGNLLKALIWRVSLGIREHHKAILFAGKLEPKKNPIHLLEVFGEIQKYMPELHLIFVGNGILEEELKERAKKIPKVTFVDFQNQQTMPIVYRLADIFILPSKGPGETWGLSVNEAMACGLPVVVSNKVGCAIDLIDDENGLIFDSESKHDLMQKLILISSKSKEDLSKMGKKSLEVIKSWSFEAIANAL